MTILRSATISFVVSLAGVASAHPGHGAVTGGGALHWLGDHAGGLALAAAAAVAGIALARLRARR
jgi:hypothetical protein